jgi:hypothetical protein
MQYAVENRSFGPLDFASSKKKKKKASRCLASPPCFFSHTHGVSWLNFSVLGCGGVNPIDLTGNESSRPVLWL